MPKLTIQILKREAQKFSQMESSHKEKSLFGVTDGKAVGTYLEHKFKQYLRGKYEFEEGSSASGIDFPELQVDVISTNLLTPYPSSPLKSAHQKIYGMEHSLIWFLYEKTDDHESKRAKISIVSAFFLDKNSTADFKTTSGIIDILKNEGNKDDVMAYILDARLANDEIEASNFADEILTNPPELGFIFTTSFWRQRAQYLKTIKQSKNSVIVYQAERWAF